MIGVWLSLHRWNDLVGPGRTARTFAFLCPWMRCLHWDSIQCELIIFAIFRCQNVPQCWWSACGYLCRIDGRISLGLDEQFVRLYSRVGSYLLLVLLFYYDLMQYFASQNVQQWRWWLCVHLGWIDGTIWLVPDEQAVRLYSCALIWLLRFDPV